MGENKGLTPFSGISAPVVSFAPRAQKFATGRPQVESVEPGLYFHEDGLERWFVFVDGSKELLQALNKEFPSTPLTSFDAVAVALPAAAEGRDVRRGRSVYPEPDLRTSNAMLFNEISLTKSARRVELRYEVPASAEQLAASSTGLKLVLVLIVPIFTLFFLDAAEINRPLLRHRAIQIGIVIQIILTVAVLFLAFAVRRPNASAVGELVVGATAIIGEIIVLLVKAKPRRMPKPR